MSQISRYSRTGDIGMESKSYKHKVQDYSEEYRMSKMNMIHEDGYIGVKHFPKQDSLIYKGRPTLATIREIRESIASQTRRLTNNAKSLKNTILKKPIAYIWLFASILWAPVDLIPYNFGQGLIIEHLQESGNNTNSTLEFKTEYMCEVLYFYILYEYASMNYYNYSE